MKNIYLKKVVWFCWFNFIFNGVSYSLKVIVFVFFIEYLANRFYSIRKYLLICVSRDMRKRSWMAHETESFVFPHCFTLLFKKAVLDVCLEEFSKWRRRRRNVQHWIGIISSVNGALVYSNLFDWKACSITLCWYIVMSKQCEPINGVKISWMAFFNHK